MKEHFVGIMISTAHLVCYDHLKQLMITTFEMGYPKPVKSKGKQVPNIIYNNEDWCAVCAEVQQYVVMLEDEGQLVDVDDLNETKEGVP